MNKHLRILHLEDEPDFAELVRSLFAQDGMAAEVQRVSDRASFEAALHGETFDVIISDYHLPSFTGLEALNIAKEKCPHTPFILVSGTIGEDAAIKSLKAGATDYVLKQHPERLPSAVRRAVQEAQERLKLHEAEMELIRREKYFRALTENSVDVLSVLDPNGVVIYKSPSVKNVLGYESQELTGHSCFKFIHPDDVGKVQEAFESLLNQPANAVTIQYRYLHKDGSWRYLEVMGQNRLSDPHIQGVVVNSRDVTDRWRVAEELRSSEKHYRLLFQANPNPMWVFDLETLQFLEVNEAAIQHYGYTHEEFLNMTIMDIRPPEKNGRRKNPTLDFSDRGVTWRHRRKDGSLIDVEVIWSPMVFHNRFAALTMASDVTERRRVEHRNAIFSKLSHRMSGATTPAEAAMIICDAADGLFIWDDFALDLYSPERDEVFSLLNITTVDGQRVEIPASAQPKAANALVRRVISRGAELLSSVESKDQLASTMLVPIRKGERVIGILFVQNHLPGSYSAQDLEVLQTLADQCGGALERLRHQSELRETEQRFRDLFENSPDAIFVEDMDGTVLDANFAACILNGMTRDQLIGKNAIRDLVPFKSREQAQKMFQQLAAGKLSWAEGESLAADGRVTPVEVRASRIDYAGKPALLLHVRDCSERRATETALQSSEMLFRSVWENSADGMRLTDENGIIVAANDAYSKLVGLTEAELKDKPFTIVYAESEDRETMLAHHREHFAMRQPERKFERRYTLHTGKSVMLQINDSFIEARGQPLLMVSLFRDVTMQRRLEEQLRQSQKMEAIGQLAGGVAHDFNNILTVIHGHASLLLMNNLDDTAARSAQQVVQAAERAAGLTRQLLAFSRRQLIQPKRLDMNKIVGNMSDMLGRLLGEDIALQLNYSASPAIVEADAGMMEQVLLNLAVNARDAMPRGGRLSVRISVVEINEAHVQKHPEARAGKFVCISKSDTGSGIAPENISRIFEPFFTTKEVGKGTGLGLATVYGIVKQHQGWLEVESTIGKGSTFRVYIPFVGETNGEAEKPTTQLTIRGGEEAILLVEDERPVRELVARVLQKYGYKIFHAGTGAEAMEVWDQHRNEIHLLLTDLVMPGEMNGRDLAEKLWAETPELKVIFTSGYSADIVGKDFKLEPEVNFLQKPYHPQTLALTVRRCLDGKTATS
ncbi:MAG TPA: PAS domain S-box protein [Verrucomicrobiae bacterium]|nr:PAS domain S-box protein [Verrucomicrobiae bacterium]